jgi:hypothetical protein
LQRPVVADHELRLRGRAVARLVLAELGWRRVTGEWRDDRGSPAARPDRPPRGVDDGGGRGGLDKDVDRAAAREADPAASTTAVIADVPGASVTRR